MSIKFKARPYKTVNGFIYVLSTQPMLKPDKVDEVIVVPDAIMDSISDDSFKYLYNDDFIELFRDLNDFDAIKKLLTKLSGGEIEKQSIIELGNWTKYTLGTSHSKVWNYLIGFLPANYEVFFKNGSSIIIKDLVPQSTPGKNGFRLFQDVEGKEYFKFPKDSVDRIEKLTTK